MGIFRHFPYSNFHEMNMDEIIEIVKTMLEEWAEYHAAWDEWMQSINDDWSNYQEVMNEAWQDMQDFINNYFDNLNVQTEINNKITAMVNSGEFITLVAPYIPAQVSSWLAQHITEPEGVVIDTSLSVAGACADAKATGDAITDIKTDLTNITGNTPITFSDPTRKQYINTSGDTVDWSTPSVSGSINIKWSVLECEEGDSFTISGKGGNSDRLWAFADSSKNIISRSAANATANKMVITAPENAAYLILNDEIDSLSYIGILLVSRVEEIETYLPSEVLIADKNSFATGYYINATIGQDWTDGLVESSNSLYTATALDLTGHIGDNLIIEIASNDAHTGVRELGFCNSENITSKAYNEGNLLFNAVGGYLRAVLPISNSHAFLSFYNKNILNIYIENKGIVLQKATTDIKYVAANGDDSNSGDIETPFATINHALEMGAKRICVKGGVYEQTVDLNATTHSEIAIINATPTEQVLFKHPGSLLATAETQMLGYTKVYSASVSGKIFATGNNWIFQESIPDADTLITSAERLPEQRGYEYRCPDTKIIKVTADNLDDALAEIETSEEYKWFYTNNILYYSRPANVDSDHALRGSFNDKFINNTTRQTTLTMVGIDIKYMKMDISKTANCKIIDCSVSNAFSEGGFIFTSADNATFIRCEAAHIYAGNNGDGFNAHSTNEGDAFAHQTTARLINCWSHDNNDDGVSLHERSEFNVEGGLYEYNYYGGGVTPANGSHCTCLGVIARKNGEGGFLYMNPAAASEGGVGGQIKCIDCVSDSNNIWYSAVSAGFKINSAGNRGIMINCKALNEDRGYHVSDSNGSMELIDCGAYNCASVKSGVTANITVTNTTLVS